ncbi:hypothetical protein [Paracoccus chinensis]|uniref:Uncharacterized protein n=1 Tax=Paracoccus chinensis TaxID=525640 RepID=A0A1G9MNN4_9RHOB|nr:hypothetical protein [Paracoccus chinensis]SDL75868.1 hypothetical protein SAMN04487971_12227 [Paracoccus chinensis]
MANLISNTRCGAVEASTLPPPPLSIAFAALLAALDTHIQCERELDEVDLWDPAYRAWLDDAETAELRLYEVLAHITSSRPASLDDAPLWRMALLIATLVREGTASAFRRYAATEAEILMHLRVPGESPAALRVRSQIAAARRRIADMAGLTLYRQDGDVEGACPDLCAAAA